MAGPPTPSTLHNHSQPMHTHPNEHSFNPLYPCCPLRYSWNKAQLEKARNEAQTQTNPFASVVRGVLSSLPTAILTLAAISTLQSTRYNK